MRTLYDEKAIERRVDEMAQEIARDLPKDFILAPVLTGAFIFAADLLRALYNHGADPLVDFVQLSSYGGARSSSGVVTLLKDFSLDIKGRTILLLDDVLDTGRSLHFGRGMVLDRGAERRSKPACWSKSSRAMRTILCAIILDLRRGQTIFLSATVWMMMGRRRGLPVDWRWTDSVINSGPLNTRKWRAEARHFSES